MNQYRNSYGGTALSDEETQAALRFYGIKSMTLDQYPDELNEKDAADARRMRGTGAFGATDEDDADSTDNDDDDDDDDNHGGDGGGRSKPPKHRLSRSTTSVENMPLTDEPDPLGLLKRTVTEAINLSAGRRGVAPDPKLPGRMMLASTQFSASRFLAEMHHDTPVAALRQGLKNLVTSIDQQSGEVQALVQDNFKQLMRTKLVIGQIYDDMRGTGQGVEEGRRRRSNFATGAGLRFDSTRHRRPGVGAATRSQHALVKETGFGTASLKDQISATTVLCQEYWGSSLTGQAKEDVLRELQAVMVRHRRCFELASVIEEAIHTRDNGKLVENYYAARKYASVATQIVAQAAESGEQISADGVAEVVVISRMWADVDKQVDQVKSRLFERLVQHADARTGALPVIRLLLELGVNESPVWAWLHGRARLLEIKIVAMTERGRLEIEVLRRRLTESGPRTDADKAVFLRQTVANRDLQTETIDYSPIVRFWRALLEFARAVLGLQNGLLADLANLWTDIDTVHSGGFQTDFPVGYQSESKRHHNLTTGQFEELSSHVAGLIQRIGGEIQQVLRKPPPEDVSHLYSPDAGPLSPASAVTGEFASVMSVLAAGPASAPPPRFSDQMAEYAFWPPGGLAIGGAHFLPHLVGLVVDAAEGMSSLSINKRHRVVSTDLANLVNIVRQTAAEAVCKAWVADATAYREVEDWVRNEDISDITQFPSRFAGGSSAVLVGLKQLLYQSSKTKIPRPELARDPSADMLGMINRSFVEVLRETLAGMVENAKAGQPGGWVDETDPDTSSLLTTSTSGRLAVMTARSAIDAASSDTRTLLTFSNVEHLAKSVFPVLLRQLSDLKVPVSDRQAFTKLTQSASESLLEMFFNPYTSQQSAIITTGFFPKDWRPGEPTTVQPYIKNLLFSFVQVHSAVTKVAPSQVRRILELLNIYAFRKLKTVIGKRQSFNLGELLQVMIDIHFYTVTLEPFSSKESVKIEGELYQRVDDLAGPDVKNEMRGLLDTITRVSRTARKDNANAFACFAPLQSKHRVRDDR